jgi:hypothetical protein
MSSESVEKLQLTFFVSADLAKRVAEAAKAEDRSVASYLRHLVRSNVEQRQSVAA